jgi:DNA-binding MarR family transcriptional regulator
MDEEGMERRVPAMQEEWALLNAAFIIARKAGERALARWEVTLPQAMVLVRVVDAKKPVPLTHLARFMLQESPSVTTLVDRMCERGLVERTRDPKDRRKALIVATEKGRQLRNAALAALSEVHKDLWGAFSDGERDTFRDLLRKFRSQNIKQIR